jgi:MFS family permease
MRRLVLLVSAIVLVDTLFFAAITPLLPYYSDRLDLSKSAAGVLTGAYPAGTLLFSIPAGWLATRIGVRPAVLGGLAIMAAASITFGFADEAWLLGGARFVQGAGSALTWAGGLAWLVGSSPVDRRAEAIGTAFGAAIGGALLGPVLGAAARLVGTEVAFGAVAVSNVVLAVIASRTAVATGAGPAAGGVLEALRERRTVAGLMSALASPYIGRWVDRSGPIGALQLGVIAGAACAILLPWPANAGVLVLLVVAAAPVVDALWVPGMTLISDGTERRGVDQAYAFALVNLTWASAALGGSAGGSALADATSDAVPYLLLASAFTVAAILTLTRRAASQS